MKKEMPEGTKLNSELKKDWSLRIMSILILLIVIEFFVAIFYFETRKPEPEEYFIKYEDATMLVEIKYGERSSIWGYKKASGFINSDVFYKYENNEYDEESIKVYHPYLRGESIMVDTDSIVTITVKTYENFYDSYPLDIYAN